MKRVITLLLSLMLVLSLAACGNSNNNGGKTEVTLTAAEVLDSLKKSLGESYTSDTAETEDRMTNYWGLDLSQVESAIILKVKDGYANTAAAALQKGFDQIVSYNRMYDMDLQRVLQGRLYINGNYVALLIEGQQGDWQASAEDQAKFAAEEAAKVDEAWKAIFGAAVNAITIPADDGNSGFNFNDDSEDGLLGG